MIKCKKICIGGSTVIQILALCCGSSDQQPQFMVEEALWWDTDTGTLLDVNIHTHMHARACAHTQIKLLVCILAHSYACAYKDTNMDKLFCWGFLINFFSAKSEMFTDAVSRDGRLMSLKSLPQKKRKRPHLASFSSHNQEVQSHPPHKSGLITLRQVRW